MSVEVFVPRHGGVPPGGSVGQSLMKLSNTDYDYAWRSTGGALSPGQIIFAGSQPQEGYLKCDGSIYQKAAYPDLASVIGTPRMVSNPIDTATGVVGTFPLRSANNVIFAEITTAATTGEKTTATADAFRTSTDGITFTSRTGYALGSRPYSSRHTQDARTAVAYGANMYVHAVGYYQNTTLSIATSPDLAAWTRRLLPGDTSPTIYEVAFGGTANVFIAVGQNRWVYTVGNWTYIVPAFYLATSTNGTTWTNRSIAAFGDQREGTLVSVAASPNLVIVIKDDFRIKSSTDGLNYTNRTFTGIGNPTRVSAIGSTHYISTSTGDLYTTTDAVNFTHIGNCGLASCKVLNNGSSMFVATTGKASRYTMDMVTWYDLPEAVSTVAGGRFWGRRNGDTIFYISNNSYNVVTEFPVPYLVVEPANGQIGNYGFLYGWIKT